MKGVTTINGLVTVFALEPVSRAAVAGFACPTCNAQAGEDCRIYGDMILEAWAKDGGWAHGRRRALVPEKQRALLVLKGIEHWEASDRLSDEGKRRIVGDRERLLRKLRRAVARKEAT